MFGRKLTIWLAFGCSLMASGCAKNTSSNSDEFGDFALGKDSRTKTAPIKDNKALRDNRDTTNLPSSFPLKIRVGKGRDTWDAVPAKAQLPKFAVQAKRIKGCLIGIKTEIIQLNRYLKVKDDWIKMDDGMTPGDVIKLDAGQSLFLSLNSKLQVYLAKSQQANCAKILREKKTYLGHVSMGASSLGLLSAPKTPSVSSSIGLDTKDHPKTYVTWKSTDQFPELVDENGIPLWIESPIFQMTSLKDGFYYVAATAQLGLQP